MCDLFVDFCGETWVVDTDDSFTFGRSDNGDLKLDDNPFLHRELGVLAFRQDYWWLTNRGSDLILHLADNATMAQFSLSGGHEVSIPFEAGSIRCTAGDTNYEITFRQLGFTGNRDVERQGVGPPTTTSTATISKRKPISLAKQERALARQLAAPTLRSPGRSIVVPDMKTIEQELNWEGKQCDRALDRVCVKFHEAGFPGVMGTEGKPERERRRNLIRHLIDNGFVTEDDI